MPENAEASEEPVLVTREAGALVVTINRPRQRNAVDLAVARGVAAAFDELDATPELRVGIITGAGGYFCAGMDIKAFARGERAHVGNRGFAGFVEAPPAKPLIAAVEGTALGGGFEIVLACDLVVAGRSARFGLPEVRRGLVAGGGGALRLPKRLPQAVALEVLLTGEPIDAARAEHFGLVNRVVPDGETVGVALELAAAISLGAPLALAAVKRIVSESPTWPAWPVADSFAAQRTVINPVFASEDAQEGARAFIERRAPVWQGR